MELVIRASHALEKKAERALRKIGLTYPQFEAMRTLKQAGASQLGQVADTLGCSRGNLTGVMDRLEREQLIDRVRSAEDRRVVNVTLTAEGEHRLELAEAIVRSELGRSLPDQVANFLTDLITRLEGATV